MVDLCFLATSYIPHEDSYNPVIATSCSDKRGRIYYHVTSTETQMTASTLNANAAPFEMAFGHLRASASWEDDIIDNSENAQNMKESENRKGRSSHKTQNNWRQRDSSVASSTSTVASLRSTTKDSRKRRGGRQNNKQKPVVASEELSAALSSVESDIAVPAALPLTRSAASELALIFEGL